MPTRLWRFDATVYQNKSGGDLAQVPATANVDFYLPGPSVTQAVTLPVTINDPDPQPTTVLLADTSGLVPGTLLKLQDFSVSMSVAEVLNATSAALLNLSTLPVTLASGDRLINTAPPRPVAYKDQQGNISLGSTIATDAATGRALAYLRDSRVDYVVTGSGLTTRSHVDLERGTTPNWVNGSRYASIQQAIDLLPAAGGTVYLPADTYIVTETILIPKNKRVHLIGDGVDRTIIKCTLSNKDILWVKGSGSTIEDLTIEGPNVAGPGRGIVLGLLKSDNPTDVLRRVSIIGVNVLKTASWAVDFIHLLPDPGDPNYSPQMLSIWGHFERCVFRDNVTAGLVAIGTGNTTQLFVNCAFCRFRGYGVNAFGASGLTFLECTFEDKQDDLNSYATLDGVNNALFAGCWFEAHTNSANMDLTRPFIDVGPTTACRDVSIVSPRFARNVDLTPTPPIYPRLLRVASSSKSIWLSNPTYESPGISLPADRYETSEAEKKDVNIVSGSEVHVSGGILKDAGFEPKGLALSGVSRTVIVASGPKITAPPVTTDERDDPDSLAVDRKLGDVVFNSDTEGLQLWFGSSDAENWASLVDTRGSVDIAFPGSPPGGTLVAEPRPGLYRVSCYVVADPGAADATITLFWDDAEGGRQRILIAHSASASETTTGGADTVVMVAGGILEYATNILGGYRVSLRAEAV